MSRKTTVWLIVAASLILIGGILFTGVMTMLKFDFSKLSATKYETQTYAITEPLRHVSICAKTADIVLVSGEDAASVVCHEQTHLKHTVQVEEGTLMITVHDTRKWYEYITLFNFETPKITVTLPSGTYNTLAVTSSTGDVEIPNGFTWETIDISATTGDVRCDASAVGAMNIHLSTGNIDINNASAGSADLTVTTGDITVNDLTCDTTVNTKVNTGKTELTSVSCKTLVSKGTTGDLMLTDVIAADTFSLERSTGDVTFDRSDAAVIAVKVTTGDVTGSLLSDKVFFAQSDTGRVDVPNTQTGGQCEITASTGRIRIEIAD